MKPLLCVFALLLCVFAPIGFAQEDIETKLKEFADAMKTAKADADRVKAIETLAATRQLKAAQKITQVIAGPYAENVRVAAADAVGRIGDPKAGPGLQSILSSFGGLLSSENPNRPADQKAAEGIVRALGTIRDRSSVRTLTSLLISNNIPLMGEAVKALAKIRDASCLEGLLKLHYAANAPEGGGATNPRKPLATETLWALRRITGQKHTTPDEWNKWYKTVGRAFVPPPEESLGGLPPEVKLFAVYAGKGEIAALRKFDLVLVNPDNYTKEELGNLFRPIALSGDPKAAMDKGCAGFVVEPDQAQEMRKKFPRALLIAKGGGRKGAPFANAILVDDIDVKKPDDAVLTELKYCESRHDTVTLAVFVAADKKDAQPALDLAKKNGFLVYVSPDKDHAAVGTLSLP